MRYDPAEARELLRRTPPVLDAWLTGLPDAWLDAPEKPGAWSAREVASHMADLEEDAWLPRARWILEHGADAPLPAVDPERFRRRWAGAALPDVLDAFAAARARNLEALAGLALDGGDALERPGLHGRLGPVTLGQLLATWVVHDLTHLSQISRALASPYREAVGSWRAYLSVLAAREGEGGAGGRRAAGGGASGSDR